MISGFTLSAELNTDTSTNETPANTTASEDTEKSLPELDILYFKNGDRLHGTLDSILEDGQIAWKHPEITQPLNFTISNLKGITFIHYKNHRETAGNIIAYLTNGDILPGHLISITPSELKMSTYYAGIMKIKREMIKSIAFNGGGGDLFSGPNSKDEWSIGKNKRLTGNFKVEDRTLFLEENSLAAATIKKADRMKISFTIPRFSNKTALNFLFLSDRNIFAQTMQVNTYFFTIKKMKCSLKRETDDTGIYKLDAFTIPQKYIDKPLKITIFIDKLAMKFSVSINGKQRKFVDDEYGTFAGRGNIIAFTTKSKEKIRNIYASTWEPTDNPNDFNSSKNETENDSLYFLNGDKTSGTLKEASESEIIFSTDFAELKVPLERVMKFTSSEVSRERAKRRKEDIKAELSDGEGILTIGLHNIQNNILNGKSDNFGTVKLNLKTSSFLYFNIYDIEQNNHKSAKKKTK